MVLFGDRLVISGLKGGSATRSRLSHVMALSASSWWGSGARDEVKERVAAM